MSPLSFGSSALDKKGIYRYVVFSTDWGYCAFICGDETIVRFLLPSPDRRELIHSIESLKIPAAASSRLLPDLQVQVRSYFSGRSARFDCRVDLSGLPAFSQRVLHQCCAIPPGKTLSYKQLASRAGKPLAGRAVGQILAANQAPIIIPCHRVIRSDGSIGGYIGSSDNSLKKRLITHEADNF
jgi:methylated-DNA-[protein]-cysteine S-methyltransferase